MDIERSLIKHFTNLESFQKIWDQGIRSEHFFDVGIRELFDYSLDYYVRSEFKQTVTQDFLETKFDDYFDRHDWPEEEYLVGVLIEEMVTKYRKSTAQGALLQAANALDKDPEEGISIALSNLSRIQSDTSTRARIEIYGEGYDRRVNQYMDEVANPTKDKKGIYLGWDALNDHMYGIRKGELAVVVGIPNVGKSWVGSVIALEAARRKNKVYFASLELSKELTLMRLDCLVSGVPYTRYERGELTPNELKRLKDAREEIMEFGEYLLIDSPSKKSERSVMELYSKAKHWGAELMVGDQLSWITTDKNFGSNSNYQSLQMSEVITDVAATNREMGMASVWLAQFNREATKSKKGRGGLGNIGLSSQIEQIVDIALGIGCTQEMKRQEALVLDIMKSRRSNLKSWMMSMELHDRTNLSIVREYEEANAE